MDRRLRQHGVVLFFSLIVFLSVWQIITGPGPPLSPVENVSVPAFYSTPNSTYPMSTSALNVSDYNQLIDIENFSFTIFNSVCNETEPFLIILVHSAPRNVYKRKTIRETWGRSANNVKLLFMLGLVKNDSLQKDLEKENETYGDFIQGTFLDSYRNVTYKHAMVFKYVIYHCQHAKFLLKTDDDVFVNINTMYNYLYNDISPSGAKNLLICEVLHKARAMRSYRSKWRVSYKEYPHRFYPPYCPGWVLIYSTDVVFGLYKELQKMPYFWIDDVLITGIIFKKLKLVHAKHHIKSINKDEQDAILRENYTSEVRPFLYGRAELEERDIRTMWNYSIKYVKVNTNQNHEAPSP